MNKTIKPIITAPHPSLRKKSRQISQVNSSIKKLAEAMKTATLAWEDSREHEIGVALAAVQINELCRLIIVRNNYEDKSDRRFNVYINPEIIKSEGKTTLEMEGCLSVKDLYGKVARYPRIKVKALDLRGRSIFLNLEGFLARIFQHEIDHTNGIIFTDYINNPDELYQLGSDGRLIIPEKNHE